MSLRSGAAGSRRAALTDSRHTRTGHENDRKLPHCAAELMRPPQEPMPAAGGAQGSHSAAAVAGPAPQVTEVTLTGGGAGDHGRGKG